MVRPHNPFGKQLFMATTQMIEDKTNSDQRCTTSIRVTAEMNQEIEMMQELWKTRHGERPGNAELLHVAWRTFCATELNVNPQVNGSAGNGNHPERVAEWADSLRDPRLGENAQKAVKALIGLLFCCPEKDKPFLQFVVSQLLLIDHEKNGHC